MEIKYFDRQSGQICVEKVYGHKTLAFLYGDGWSSCISKFILPLLAHIPFFSIFYGYLQKRPGSAKAIWPFIRAYGVDINEFEQTEFASFNDFFIRKLKKKCRPIVPDANRLAMPADGRYLVYPHFDHFEIKGKTFSLPMFLQDADLARRYSDGAMAIVRLCPTDYHRFHFPCAGTPGKAKLINGPLFSVNPIALQKRISIFAENKRMVTVIETERFGVVLYVEVGATAVGSIHQTYAAEKIVQKGDEKGYFEFGGSCIVLLFERGRIQFDADLLENTKKGFETKANFGQSLGIVCK